MDVPEYYWDHFLNTGNIESYLAYKNLGIYSQFAPSFASVFDPAQPQMQVMGGLPDDFESENYNNYEELQKRINKI